MAGKKNHKDRSVKETEPLDVKRILIAIIILGIVLLFYDVYCAKFGFTGELERYAYGEGDYEEEVSYVAADQKGSIGVEVVEQTPNEDEAKEAFAQAIEEIDATFLGTNSDVDHISSDVVVKDTYADGMVSASWSFSDYDLITTGGEVILSNLSEDSVVEASVRLTSGNYESSYQFSFCICLPEEGSEEALLLQIQKELEGQSSEDASVVLPTSIAGTSVQWTKKIDYRGLVFIVIGVLLYLFYPQFEKIDKNRELKKREESLRMDYPVILGQLSLLLQVGIRLPEALLRIRSRYEKKLAEGAERRPGFDLVVILSREIQDGRSTVEALERFGRNGKEYRKLALLLEQMGQRGGDQLIIQLQKEETEAFEMRKMAARRLGEEASTKLLVPMMGMLAIVLLVILVPALMMVTNS